MQIGAALHVFSPPFSDGAGGKYIISYPYISLPVGSESQHGADIISICLRSIVKIA